MRRFTLFLVVLLTGCAVSMDQVNRQVGEDQPLAYREGYVDGCNSGYVAAGHPYRKFSKSVTRYTSDVLYRQGWDDGKTVCKGKYDAIGRR